MKHAFNAEILSTAEAFHGVAKVIEEKEPEIGEYLPAYASNLAFAVELYLKALAAISFQEQVFEVAGVKITGGRAQSQMRGHILDRLFRSLPGDVRDWLEVEYHGSKHNLYMLKFLEQLERVGDAFQKARYIFEAGTRVFREDAEELRYICKFFEDVSRR